MRVIVDLHGGEPNDFVAQAEFQEIKDKVMHEVSVESYGPSSGELLCWSA